MPCFVKYSNIAFCSSINIFLLYLLLPTHLTHQPFPATTPFLWWCQHALLLHGITYGIHGMEWTSGCILTRVNKQSNPCYSHSSKANPPTLVKAKLDPVLALLVSMSSVSVFSDCPWSIQCVRITPTSRRLQRGFKVGEPHGLDTGSTGM